MREIWAGFHHILAPINGSQSSVTAGRLAVQLTALHKAHITFVYVVDDAVVAEMAGVSGRVAKRVQSELELSGQRSLDYLSRLASEADLTSSQVIRHGVPYREITNLAREQGVDLIVVGQVGSRGPRRILIGSVTERIIERSPCAVLVVK
jgi:nucleotide-binding universal stress UspA family protein